MFLYGCNCGEKTEDQIPTVTTEFVTDITPTSAICVGNVISCGGSYWFNRGICWSNFISEPTLSDDYRWSDAGAHTGNFPTLLDYLTPGTTYYVRAYASNDAGVAYGSIIEFSTTGSVVGEIIFNDGLIYDSLGDIAGNTYKTIKIGTQTWMAENLKTTKYYDGSDIPLITDLVKWFNLTTPGFSWYLNNEAKYKNTYGALYNWYTVNTGKLCPTGWHVPGDAEWTVLISYLGGESEAGGKLKENNTTHWITGIAGNPLIGIPASTNSSGFTALPGGCRQGVKTDPVSYFTDLGYQGNFWSATEYDDPGQGLHAAYNRTCNFGSEACDRMAYTKTQGLSVRCIKDN